MTVAPSADVAIIEIGGTVGVISRACPSWRPSASSRVTWQRERLLHPPDPGALYQDRREVKTKPTQHSVKELRSIGIQPISFCAAPKRS